jgi:CRP-like cAMP-binding protein
MTARTDRCTFCRRPIVSGMCELAGLRTSTTDLEFLCNRFQPHQLVFQEGNPALAVYCVTSGMIKLYKLGRNGDHLILRLHGPGSLIGYRPVLAGEPYAASAEVVEAATICIVSRESFLELLKRSPEFSRRMLAKMAREMRYSEEQSLALAQEPVLERTAHMLLSLPDICGTGLKQGAPLRVPLLRSEMAQMIGTTPETLSRALHKLARRGVVRLTRTEIYVRDLGGLRSILSCRSS